MLESIRIEFDKFNINPNGNDFISRFYIKIRPNTNSFNFYYIRIDKSN